MQVEFFLRDACWILKRKTNVHHLCNFHRSSFQSNSINYSINNVWRDFFTSWPCSFFSFCWFPARNDVDSWMSFQLNCTLKYFQCKQCFFVDICRTIKAQNTIAAPSCLLHSSFWFLWKSCPLFCSFSQLHLTKQLKAMTYRRHSMSVRYSIWGTQNIQWLHFSYLFLWAICPLFFTFFSIHSTKHIKAKKSWKHSIHYSSTESHHHKIWRVFVWQFWI